MKKLLLTLLVVSGSAFAQSDIQQNLNAITNAQNQNIAAENQRIYEQQAAQRAAQQKYEAQQAAAAKAAAKRQAAVNAEAARQRNRRESYEDANNSINIEERRAALAMKQAQAKRADDYAGADLNHMKAKTDVVQSVADSNRNVSQGQKDMMTGVGAGSAKGKGVFGN